MASARHRGQRLSKVGESIQRTRADELELGHSDDVILAGLYGVSMQSLQRIGSQCSHCSR